MGRLLTITATGQQRLGVRKRTLTGTGVRVGPVTIQLVLIVACTALGFFYLIQSNRVSTANLKLQDFQSQKNQVTEQNERLSTEAARLQSLQQTKKAAEAQQLKVSEKANAYAG